MDANYLMSIKWLSKRIFQFWDVSCFNFQSERESSIRHYVIWTSLYNTTSSPWHVLCFQQLVSNSYVELSYYLLEFSFVITCFILGCILRTGSVKVHLYNGNSFYPIKQNSDFMFLWGQTIKLSTFQFRQLMLDNMWLV